MGVTRTRIFWSIYCILVGLALLGKILFRLEFSGWTMAIAILLLESGAFLLSGGFGMNRFRRREGGGTCVFFRGSARLSAQSPDFVLILGDAVVDFSQPMPPRSSVFCLFGSMTVRVPEGWSVRANCSSAFGGITTPRGAQPAFGEAVCIVGDGLQAVLDVRCICGQVNLLD